jgi:hypothetical protein
MSDSNPYKNDVVLALSSDLTKGTGGVYVNGTIEATWDERRSKSPPIEFLRAQALRWVKYPEEGHTFEERTIDWPLPVTLPDPLPEPTKPAKETKPAPKK